MKISTNAINNYMLQVSKPNKPGNHNQNELGVLSGDEKKYFADAYPASTKEIMDYHYYNREGKMSGVSIGSNIDRRG